MKTGRLPDFVGSVPKRIAFVALGTLFILPAVAAAADEVPRTLEGAYKTEVVMDRAIEAFGGQAFLDGINAVKLKFSGTSYSSDRSWNAEQGVRPMPAVTEVEFQIEEGNYRYGGAYDDREYSNMITSANSYWANTITDEGVHLLFPLLKMATSGFALPRIREGARALVPHLVVRRLVEERGKLAWLGEDTIESRVVDLMAYPEGVAGYSVFAFDRESGVLVSMQRPVNGGAVGDTVREVRFGGYRQDGQTILPRYRRAYLGDQLRGDYVFDKLDLNAELDAARFRPPADYRVFENLPNRDSDVLTVADHVYWLPLGAASLFVEFDDYVIAVNTPGGAARHRTLIHDVIGDKPVRFAITMDHHPQQTAGVRTYVAEGIPIITTSGNRDYLEKLATSYSTLRPDALARAPRSPVFEIVDERRVFDDGTTRLEIVNIGPTQHAEDQYVAYLPKERIIFAADFFNFNPGALPIAIPPEYMGLARDGLAALKRAGIEADTLVLAHGWGWRTIPIAEIERIVAEASAG